jgi:hypothetical protein
MKISMHVMSVGSFVPMLESLSAVLDKGALHAKTNDINLVDARLAPDMFALAKQVQLACDNACNGAARLAAQEPPAFGNDETTFADLKTRIARAVAYLRQLPSASFDGAEDRDCTFPMPNNPKLAFAMNGLDFLRAWALPHFYFHVVTAYDILRHNGAPIGKQDYLSQVGAFVRPRGD